MSPVYVMIALICSVAGWSISRQEGHPVWGAVVGLMLGPVGVVITGVSLWAHRRRNHDALQDSQRP